MVECFVFSYYYFWHIYLVCFLLLNILFRIILFRLVGYSIIGRILINGDLSITANLNPNDQVIVQLIDTSILDAPAVIIASFQSTNVPSLPTTYQITTTANLELTPNYSLSARILRSNTILYMNVERVSLKIEKGGISSVDIPVRAIS